MGLELESDRSTTEMAKPMGNRTKILGVGCIFTVLVTSLAFTVLLTDSAGPTIYEIDILPVTPEAGDTIYVMIYCIDTSGVSGASLRSSLNDMQWVEQEMEFYACLCIAGGRWVGALGPVQSGDVVRFYATAFDSSATRNTAETQTYTVQIDE